MIYDRLISQMEFGTELEGFYVLKTAAAKSTAAGKPFLTGELSDRSGGIEFVVWDYSGPIGTADVGKVIKIRGKVLEYRGSPQLNISRLRLPTPQDSYDLAALVPTAPIDADAALAELQATVASIADPDYRRLAQTLLARNLESFRRIPAAKSVHHSFLSGLLMHTSDMLKAADFLAGLYARIIDRSLLLAGTLLHDLMKREEFCFSELGLVTDYSVKGQLLGHLVMGAQEVAAAARELEIPEEKSVLLQHLILSHHGTPEFGAAVLPQCAEAELLSYIDGIDSRMEIYAETLRDLPEGQFSPRVYALERRLYKHARTAAEHEAE